MRLLSKSSKDTKFYGLLPLLLDTYYFRVIFWVKVNLLKKKTIHTVCEIVEAVKHGGVEELNAKQLN